MPPSCLRASAPNIMFVAEPFFKRNPFPAMPERFPRWIGGAVRFRPQAMLGTMFTRFPLRTGGRAGMMAAWPEAWNGGHQRRAFMVRWLLAGIACLAVLLPLILIWGSRRGYLH